MRRRTTRRRTTRHRAPRFVEQVQSQPPAPKQFTLESATLSLFARGFKLHAGRHWEGPSPRYRLTAADNQAIDFLIDHHGFEGMLVR